MLDSRKLNELQTGAAKINIIIKKFMLFAVGFFSIFIYGVKTQKCDYLRSYCVSDEMLKI